MGDIRTSGYLSSVRQDWATPQDLFDRLDAEFHFTLDVASSDENAKCADHYTAADDGLAQPWHGTVWCNPPYGSEVGKWAKKAAEYGESGGVAVMLVASRTDTIWWNEHVVKHASEVRFVRGRLRFDDGKDSAPFASAVVVFGTPRYPRMSVIDAHVI